MAQPLKADLSKKICKRVKRTNKKVQTLVYFPGNYIEYFLGK